MPMPSCRGWTWAWSAIARGRRSSDVFVWKHHGNDNESKKRWQFPTGKDMQICHNPLAFGYPILRQIVTNPDNCLIGGLEHVLFFHILGIIIPTDFHIFQRGGSTTNQLSLLVMLVSCGFQVSFHVGSSYQDVYPQPLVSLMFVPI